MPRPGPRPYECVRRAWHSERHHPIRGSLIQEIFRIANEIHTPTTKKNKEWQEKLPIVVFKAEEIIYSKANSEAEYMDLETLRERTNDAINTIIRRDESAEETGEFLQPCIEAALHLGCVPRRASRSERNHHPRGYLSGNVDLSHLTDGIPRTPPSISPPFLNLLMGKESPNFVIPINCCISNEMPFLCSQKFLPLEPSFSSKPFPVYPLYYGAYSQPLDSQQKHGAPFTSVNKDHPSMWIPEKLPLFGDENKMIRIEPSEVLNNPPENECDLSLRLGLSPMQLGEDSSSHNSKEKKNIISCHKEPMDGFSLFCGSNGGSRGGALDVEMMVRKRKAVEQIKDRHCPWQPMAFEQDNNQQYSWQPNLLPSYSNQRTRTAGL